MHKLARTYFIFWQCTLQNDCTLVKDLVIEIALFEIWDCPKMKNACDQTWSEITDIINILIRCEFAYHFKHGLICNGKLY